MTATAKIVAAPAFGDGLEPEREPGAEDLDELDAEIEKLFTAADERTAQSALDGLLAIGSSALLSPPRPPTPDEILCAGGKLVGDTADASPGAVAAGQVGNAEEPSLDSLLWDLDDDCVVVEEKGVISDGSQDCSASDLHSIGDDEPAGQYSAAAEAASIFEDEVAEVLRVAHRQVSGLKLEAAWLRSGLLALQKDVRMLRSENDGLQGQRRRADQRLLLLLREKELAEEQRRVAEEQRRTAEDAQETLRGVVSRAVAEAAVLRRQLAVWKPPGGAWAMAVKAGGWGNAEIGGNAIGGSGIAGDRSGNSIQRALSVNSLRCSLDGSSAQAETLAGYGGGKDSARRASISVAAKESPVFKPASAVSGARSPALAYGSPWNAEGVEGSCRLAEKGRSDSGVWAEVKRLGAGMGLAMDSDVDADEDAMLLREENHQLQALLRESQCDLQVLEQNVVRLKEVVAAQETAVEAAAVAAAAAEGANERGRSGVGDAGKGEWVGGRDAEEMRWERERLRKAWEEVEREREKLTALQEQLISGATSQQQLQQPPPPPGASPASGEVQAGAHASDDDDGGDDDSDAGGGGGGCIHVICSSCGTEGVIQVVGSEGLDAVGRRASFHSAHAGSTSGGIAGEAGDSDSDSDDESVTGGGGGGGGGEEEGESSAGVNSGKLLGTSGRRHSASFAASARRLRATGRSRSVSSVATAPPGFSLPAAAAAASSPTRVARAVSAGPGAGAGAGASAPGVRVDLDLVRILELEAQKELQGLLQLSEDEPSPTTADDDDGGDDKDGKQKADAFEDATEDLLGEAAAAAAAAAAVAAAAAGGDKDGSTGGSAYTSLAGTDAGSSAADSGADSTAAKGSLSSSAAPGAGVSGSVSGGDGMHTHPALSHSSGPFSLAGTGRGVSCSTSVGSTSNDAAYGAMMIPVSPAAPSAGAAAAAAAGTAAGARSVRSGAASPAANQGLPGVPVSVSEMWSAARAAATHLRRSLEAASGGSGSGLFGSGGAGISGSGSGIGGAGNGIGSDSDDESVTSAACAAPASAAAGAAAGSADPAVTVTSAASTGSSVGNGPNGSGSRGECTTPAISMATPASSLPTVLTTTNTTNGTSNTNHTDAASSSTSRSAASFASFHTPSSVPPLPPPHPATSQHSSSPLHPPHPSSAAPATPLILDAILSENERLREDMADMALQKRQTVSHLSSLLDDVWQQHRELQRCLKDMRVAREICEGCSVCEERRQAVRAEAMLSAW